MGFTNMNRDRPTIITGKTGTGKTTMARSILPYALVLYGDELEIDESSVNVENGLIIEDIHYNANKEALLRIIRRYRGTLILTSLNEKDIPKEVKALCKIKRAGTVKYLYDSIKEIAPRSEEPFSLHMDTFTLANKFLREGDRDLMAELLKVNKPKDYQIMNVLGENLHPNKLLFIDAKVKRKWSQDYFYEMLAYVHNGKHYGRFNIPKYRAYDKTTYLIKKLGIKNGSKRVFKQLTTDESFVKYAKSKLNNTQCRDLNLGEKKIRKKKPSVKVRQTGLGDF
jgi:hypothetical protein